MAHRVFKDRDEAGIELGFAVAALGPRDAVVLGLPRGGVPVAARVAEAIAAPLDVIVVRKVGVVGQPELAMGAVGESGITVVNDDVVRITRSTQAEIDDVAGRERERLERSVERIRSIRPRLALGGCTAVIVDDGIATGATMRAAVRVARADDAQSVIVATPVAPPSVVVDLGDEADAVVCVLQPDGFSSVGRWYRHFDEVSDDEVLDLLRAAMARMAE